MKNFAAWLARGVNVFQSLNYLKQVMLTELEWLHNGAQGSDQATNAHYNFLKNYTAFYDKIDISALSNIF